MWIQIMALISCSTILMLLATVIGQREQIKSKDKIRDITKKLIESDHRVMKHNDNIISLQHDCLRLLEKMNDGLSKSLTEAIATVERLPEGYKPDELMRDFWKEVLYKYTRSKNERKSR